jgi:hypothetical protein
LSCQGIKLVGKRHPGIPFHHYLTFANHVPQLDASQDIFGRLERLESEHRFRDTFDGQMILIDDVIEVFDLTYVRGMVGRMIVEYALTSEDRNFLDFDDMIDCRLIGAAFIQGVKYKYDVIIVDTAPTLLFGTS